MSDESEDPGAGVSDTPDPSEAPHKGRRTPSGGRVRPKSGEVDSTADSGSTSRAVQTKPEIVVYTDGACSGNPGPGGWGVILMSGPHRKELKGGEADTTNNRMELMAAIMALEALKKPSKVTLFTDSQYVKNGIGSWIHGWKRNGWRTADKKPVKNAELWQQLDAARQRHEIDWQWVKGHAGHPENERADELAREGLAEARGRK